MKRIDVKQPAVIGHQNTKMGGVDLINRTLSDYRLSIYGKKWYWLLLVNVLNIGFVYYWKFSRILTGEQIEQKVVYYHIASILLRCSVQATPPRSCPARAYKVDDEIGLDGVQHYLTLGPVHKSAICKKSCHNTLDYFKFINIVLSY